MRKTRCQIDWKIHCLLEIQKKFWKEHSRFFTGVDHSLKTVRNIVCVLPNKVLSFKVKNAAYLSQIERKLVHTGANLLDQMQTALKEVYW